MSTRWFLHRLIMVLQVEAEKINQNATRTDCLWCLSMLNYDEVYNKMFY